MKEICKARSPELAFRASFWKFESIHTHVGAGAAGGAGGWGLSATRLSVVSRMADTEAAFSRAERVTLVGSTIPAAIMSQ